MKTFQTYLTSLRLEFSVARFLARWADFGLMFLLFRLLLRPLDLFDWPLHLDWYSAVILSILVNAVSLKLFGTTLWKSALGLHVKRDDDGKPGLLQALKRELLATALGMGCGIPVLAVSAGAFWGWRVLTGRRSFWNRTLGLISLRTDFLERLVGRRWGLIASASLAMLLMIEVWLVLFRAARYEVGWIVVGL